MSNKSKIRNCGEEVYINDDLTKEEKKVQVGIRKVAKVKTVEMGFRKVIIDQVV